MGVSDSRAADAEELCRRLYPRLVRSLALFCGDLAAAEELAQEAFVRTWDRWPSVSQMTNRDGWVFRVGFNLATSRARRRRIEARALAAAANRPQSGSPDVDVVLSVRAAVASLPPRERAAIVLRYFADLTVDDTAAVMACQPGTVKSLTSHAMAHLHAALGGSELEEVPTDV
jgi:RNA polymerase sigma-70 factor (sigma-E family)